MPGFPDKFMPFMDEPPGAHLSTAASGAYGKAIRALREVTWHTLEREPKWRVRGKELVTGYKGTGR
jgi:hydrogenase small subunit